MDVFLLASRLLLCAVFLVAGCAKAFDVAGTRRMLIDFGVPDSLSKPFAYALPIAEIAIAIALLDTDASRVAGAAALALLVAFSVVIAVSLAHGRGIACRCFGRLSAAPAGKDTLARNAGFAALAALVVAYGGGASFGALFGALTPSAWMLGGAALLFLVIALVEAWLLVHVIRQQGRQLLRIEALERGAVGASAGASRASKAGLAIGAVAPNATLQRLDGTSTDLGSERVAHLPMLVVFTDPACRSCTAMLPEIARWQQAHAERLFIALVGAGPLAANRAHATSHGLVNVFLQRETDVAVAFKATTTPGAVLVTPEGRIGSHVAEGPDAIRTLTATILAGVRPHADARAEHSPEDAAIPAL